MSPRIRLGRVSDNVAAVRAAVCDAVADGAQLIVAPELAVSGYAFRDAGEAAEAAITPHDSVWGEIAGDLGKAVAVVGYAERDGAVVRNSAAVLTAQGRIGDYRKSHLWGGEKNLFVPGDDAGAVFETPIGRLAVAICYDNEFPEVPRRLALAGAEILALPVNWPRVERPRGERPPEVIQAMAAARSSRLATVVADRRGRERGVPWTGGSCVIGDDGWVADAGAGGAAADLTLRPPSDKSLPPYNDLFGDRRPDAYTA